MFIAEQKKKENIVEYLIYMFQVEDIIRSCNMDINEIESKIIEKYNESQKPPVRDWYKKLIAEMREQNVVNQGHISELTEIMNELVHLHNYLLTIHQDRSYIQRFNLAAPSIKELQQKAGARAISPVETCLNGLYGLLVLRLKKREITQATASAMEAFSRMMAYLSVKYKEMKKGDLNPPSTLNN